ncbi:hypothetical protein MXMO3_02478 [Maritalea myrionectae]|uniref:ABM domain-containing protein n=1 Tax=Maritalea myrionectae TaxID=454601 RepID=A0A2R4MG56_9HYPH|nr:hypothetical protein [Maritalea myrionectae]AVX04990.1 hypothetical protein MXMO3_02478 [Maritalea myrionectae]
MSKVFIRYKVRSEKVETNIKLLRAFFEELAVENRPELTYMAYQLEDRQSFVHLVNSAKDARAFAHLPSYRKFRDTLAARCIDAPEMCGIELIGAFGQSDPKGIAHFK